MNLLQKEPVGIVGHGIIGSSWALVFARAGLPVRVWARSEKSMAEAKCKITAAVQRIAGTGLEGDADTLNRISFHERADEAFERVAYIQESVPEQLNVKRAVLAMIEAVAPSSAVIGSSTSGFMPSLMADSLQAPNRFLVVHPLTPPHLLPITEICAGPETDADVVERTISLLRAVGQHPVRLGSELPGFALNRLLGALFKECFALLQAGVIQVADVDALFTQGLGLRWSVVGPFAAMDLNAPGGIRDYLQRYGELFTSDPALVEEVAMRFEQDCAKGDRAERMRRRDRSIAQIVHFKRTLEL